MQLVVVVGIVSETFKGKCDVMLIGKAHVKATLDLWNQVGEVEMKDWERREMQVVLDSIRVELGRLYVGDEFATAVRDALCAFIVMHKHKIADLVDMRAQEVKGK